MGFVQYFFFSWMPSAVSLTRAFRQFVESDAFVTPIGAQDKVYGLIGCRTAHHDVISRYISILRSNSII